MPEALELGPTAEQFDIFQDFQRNRRDESNHLPPALAAVRALTNSLQYHPVTTVSETLSLFSTLIKELKSKLRNPRIVSAGTDTFQHYLVTTTARPGNGISESTVSPSGARSHSPSNVRGANFETVKTAIIAAGDDWVRRGLEARQATCIYGKKLVRRGSTLLVPHPSRTVADFLRNAASTDMPFRVILVRQGPHDSASQLAQSYGNLAQELRDADVPVAIIEPTAVAHTLATLPQDPASRSQGSNGDVVVLSGAASLLGTGGVMGSMGTQQAACIAKALGKEFWVVAESYKRVQWLPHGAGESDPDAVRFDEVLNGSVVKTYTRDWDEMPMDIVPASYITRIITEHGSQTPTALAEQIFKMSI